MKLNTVLASATILLSSVLAGCVTYEYKASSSDPTIIFGDQNKDHSDPARSFFINSKPATDHSCAGYKRATIGLNNSITSYGKTKEMKVPALQTIAVRGWSMQSSLGRIQTCGTLPVLFTPDENTKYSIDMTTDDVSNGGIHARECRIVIQKISVDGKRTELTDLQELPKCDDHQAAGSAS